MWLAVIVFLNAEGDYKSDPQFVEGTQEDCVEFSLLYGEAIARTYGYTNHISSCHEVSDVPITTAPE